jgi:micrococcal nuclease
MRKRLIPAAAAILLALGYFLADLSGFDFKGLLINGGSTPETGSIEKAPEKIAVVQKKGLAPNSYADVYVTDVVDGDTLEVTFNGESHKVRLLCIDTPESVMPGVSDQPYSSEAADYTRKMALNKSVRLVFEKGLRDRYGRLLAHIVLKDGSYLNAMLVRNGYARVEIVKPNNTYADYFYKLQDAAISENKGFWGLPSDKQPFQEDKDGLYIPKYRLKNAS